MIARLISAYCTSIGKDPLLVQGAGGNVSWKEEKTLWVKASGMWLADALKKNIFVPVDLVHLRAAIKDNNFVVTPKTQCSSVLKPSIETLLHALMPHKIVLHLHAVEILSQLVQKNWQQNLNTLLAKEKINNTTWVTIKYTKPGAELAAAVFQALHKNPAANIVLLQNHGVVIGGGDLQTIDSTLKKLIVALKVAPKQWALSSSITQVAAKIQQASYFPVAEPILHNLTMVPALFSSLSSAWAICPDHIVFLGERAYSFANLSTFKNALATLKNKPELVFLKEQGVFVLASFNEAKKAQLRCYYEVMIRQPDFSAMRLLSSFQVNELLNLESEKYRINMERQ